MSVVKQKNWYVLYTAARAEKQVLTRLQARGIEAWLPLHSTPRVWSDRIKMVDVPLFPSYLFVSCSEEELRGLIRVYGVAQIVFHNGRPAVVSEKEIEGIRHFLNEAANHVLCPGEDVEILCGALKHVSGKIRKIKKNYLILFLEQLNATVCVKIDEIAPVRSLKKKD